MQPKIDGMVAPRKVYYPDGIVTMWFHWWSLQCGNCEKDFVKFSVRGYPRCPYCRTVNRPQFVYYM